MTMENIVRFPPNDNRLLHFVGNVMPFMYFAYRTQIYKSSEGLS